MMHSMRTTLTLDDDVAAKLRQLAHRRRISFKGAVDVILRRGLSGQSTRPDRLPDFRVEAFRSAFRAGVDPMRLNQLADDLEAERFRAAPRRPARNGPA